MAGILRYGAYIPHFRLPRSEIGDAWAGRGSRGEKAVASQGVVEVLETAYLRDLILPFCLSPGMRALGRRQELFKGLTGTDKYARQ